MEETLDSVSSAPLYDYLVSEKEVKPRFKNALDLKKLASEQAATFEIEEGTSNLTIDEDEEEDDLDDSGPVVGDRTGNLRKGRGPVLEVLKGMNLMTAFVELEKSMVSIHEKDLVLKEIVKEGTRQQVAEDGKVFINYVALCEGGDEPFDSTVGRKTPFLVDMKEANVIPGLFHALLGMSVGEVSKVMLKSPLAFGSAGCPPRIPAGADILYIVEVLEQIAGDQLRSPLYMNAEERAGLPFKDIFEAAKELRTAGNGDFQSKCLDYAVKKYRKAINLLEDYPVLDTRDEDRRNELLHTLYSNLAQCYLGLGRFPQACNACKAGLKVVTGKRTVKLLFRFAKAKLNLKDCDTAISLCNQALKLEPTNKEVQDLKREIQVESRKQGESEKKMYRDMFVPSQTKSEDKA